MNTSYRNETELTKSIRATLNVLGVWHWKHFGGPLAKKGAADILGIWEGRFLAIEVKMPKGKISYHQQKFIDDVNRNGGIGFFARSVDDVIDSLGVRDRFLFRRQR